MLGLMQEHSLGIPAIVRHAERLHPRKTVTTRTRDGFVTATFADVIARARRLAAALTALGVKPGDRVATFAWNHQQHLEAYVAVPGIGAVLHTLNIRLFENDLAYVVEHAGDGVVIVDASLWPQWEKVAARVSCVRATIVIDDGDGLGPAGTLDYERLLAAHEELPLRDVPEGRAAAMCYTSGTTGHPKGVVYSHRSTYLHTAMLGTVDALGLCERDTVLAIVPMFHANAWGLPYGCLQWGCHLVLPGRFMAPASLAELIVERGVTFASGVPTIWLGLLEPLAAAKSRVKLTRLACAGSAVPPALQRSYRDALGIPLIHAWGMTETSPLVTFAKPLAHHLAAAADPCALEKTLEKQGRVAPGVEIRIVREDGTEAPWDGRTVGEIQVRGNWVAAGYYQDPTSAQKFSDGWLRTGDVATIDAEGYVQIADRTKDLVKSGGEWISSVELEGHIMGHPAVAEAAVIAIPHPRWSERPLACVVVKKGLSLSRDEVLAHLRTRVAKWWLPDDVVFIAEVPRTSVGKFDKKVLRERFKDHRPAGDRPPEP